MSQIIPAIVFATGLRERDVRLLITTAPSRYKTYPIAKRTGGERWISQPARELKALQRVLLTNFLCDLPVHYTASAYRPGLSIRDNAAAHQHNGPILKMDFENFFPSIKAQDWKNYCLAKSVFASEEDIDISTNILFRREKGSSVLRLAIGAPSSPHVSNVLLYKFDEIISTQVAKQSVAYTRYADDITFSARRTGYLQGIEKMVRLALRDMRSPSLRINEDKTVLATKKYKRMITGLILADDNRVTIGRFRKRQLRAALNHAERGLLSSIEMRRLAGMLAFVNGVENNYYKRIVEKYGDKLILAIKAQSRIG